MDYCSKIERSPKSVSRSLFGCSHGSWAHNFCSSDVGDTLTRIYVTNIYSDRLENFVLLKMSPEVKHFAFLHNWDYSIIGIIHFQRQSHFWFGISDLETQIRLRFNTFHLVVQMSDNFPNKTP